MPWLKSRSTAYEDWYLVGDFQSLGALNEAAINDANRKPHDEIAKEATAVAGGLYRRLQGDLRLQDALCATWIRKPALTSYQGFLGSLSKLARGQRTDLWQRQMVLGPAPEFCLHSESPIELLRSLRPVTLRVQLVGERA
jgi:hypothetical protein